MTCLRSSLESAVLVDVFQLSECRPPMAARRYGLAHARLLRDEVGIRRPILVDDLAGTTHRAYGGGPP